MSVQPLLAVQASSRINNFFRYTFIVDTGASMLKVGIFEVWLHIEHNATIVVALSEIFIE